MLVAGFEDNAKFIPRSSWPEIDAKIISAKYFQELFEQGKLPVELMPKDWTRFADNLFAILQSSESLRRDSPEQKVRKTIDAISRTVLSGESIPLSISLLQLVFAILFRAEIIAAPFYRYVPVITEEMEPLYPELLKINERFDFDS